MPLKLNELIEHKLRVFILSECPGENAVSLLCQTSFDASDGFLPPYLFQFDDFIGSVHGG